MWYVWGVLLRTIAIYVFTVEYHIEIGHYFRIIYGYNRNCITNNKILILKEVHPENSNISICKRYKIKFNKIHFEIWLIMMCWTV